MGNQHEKTAALLARTIFPELAYDIPYPLSSSTKDLSGRYLSYLVYHPDRPRQLCSEAFFCAMGDDWGEYKPKSSVWARRSVEG